MNLKFTIINFLDLRIRCLNIVQITDYIILIKSMSCLKCKPNLKYNVINTTHKKRTI